MRPSQCERLLEIERGRTSWRYGFHARVWQLKWATAVTFILYTLSRYHLWVHPREHNHVWIDEVLVEVVEDGWADKASVALFYGLMGFGSLLMAFLLCVRPERRSRKPQRGGLGSPRAAAATGAGGDGRPLENSTIRPVRSEHGVGIGPKGSGHSSGVTAATSAPTPQPRVDPSKPMRTSADLESFLQRASLEQRRQRGGAGGREGATERVAGGFFACPPPGPTDGRMGGEGTIHVRYSHGAGRGSGAAGEGLDGTPRGLSERDWEALGVHHVDHALARTREWVSDLCRHLVAEVEECDRWFAANDAAAYDCGHSLREVLQVPVAPPAPTLSMGWGAGSMLASQPQAQPQFQTTTKQQAVVEQRALIQRSDHRNFDTILRLDQRIALEVKLDVTGTFPETAQLSNAELCARQQYILQRLRTFAKQRSLVAYKHSGGDPETWRDGFPCDAHLLLHVMRTSVEGMRNYVRFGYQGSGDKAQDLALYVGDTGEPYFYVRYRGPTQDRLYATRPGALSLFESILVFASVIRVYHGDAYGGIRGTMDLTKTGLTRVLREPRMGAAWADTF